MSLSNDIIIASHEISTKIDNTKPIKDRLRDAFKLAKEHWLVTTEENRFRAGVGGVLINCTSEEKHNIEEELLDLRQFNSALETSSLGVPIDFISFLGQKDRSNFYGLMAIWNEVK